jgi:hypothetical protein
MAAFVMRHSVMSSPKKIPEQPLGSTGVILPSQPVGAVSVVPVVTAPAVLVLFVLSVLPPSYFFLGDQRLSLTRLLLIALFVPLLVRLLVGQAGRLRPIDILMMLFMAWIALTLLFHHGLERLPLAAITIVETFGAYLIGRTLVRNAEDFRLLFRVVFWAMVFLAPFVFVELLTDRNLLQEISRKFVPTLTKGISSYGRLGLNRVMAGFEHPILYGLFCAIAFTPILALHRGSDLSRLALAVFVGFMTFASLSSAPLLAVAIQIGLLAWAWVTGGRWWLLTGIIVAMYVTVDMLSNRTPITILINYISFDPATAWARVLIWRFGSAEMWSHPVFGIGLGDWARPSWLTASVDNFWLLNGMRHGVVGVALLIAAVGSGLWAVMQAPGLAGDLARLRRAYVFSLVALYFTLCTVHVWGGTGSFVMLLIGAGVWFCDSHCKAGGADDSAQGPTPEPEVPKDRGAYSRFPPRHQRPDRSPVGNTPSIAAIPTPHRRIPSLAQAVSIEAAAASTSPPITR